MSKDLVQNTIPAFPFLFVNQSTETVNFGGDNPPVPPGSAYVSSGMDLRDYFAAQAMQASLTARNWDVQALAAQSYEMADAMLEARKK